MTLLYHGSSTSNLKFLEPHRSTHGTYVYATPYKELAIIFSGRSGDDQVMTLYRNDETDPWQLVERIPGCFEKVFNNSASLYTIPSTSFIDINTDFAEVVSETQVPVLSEEKIENTYDAVKELAKEGKIQIYSYPNRPHDILITDDDLIERELYYHIKNGLPITNHTFDRVVLLHPNLLGKVNELLKKYDIDFTYHKEDLVSLFKTSFLLQIASPSHEQYLSSIFISITKLFPELTNSLETILEITSKSHETFIIFLNDFIKEQSLLYDIALPEVFDDNRPISKITKEVMEKLKQEITNKNKSAKNKQI